MYTTVKMEENPNPVQAPDDTVTPQESAPTEVSKEMPLLVEAPLEAGAPMEPMVLAEPTIPPEPSAKKPKRSKKNVALMLAVILVNVGIAATSAYLFVKNPAVTVAATTAASPAYDNNEVVKVLTDQQSVQLQVADAAANKKTQHYVSQTGIIEFDYPTLWRISASDDDANIRITSATFNYTDNKGASKIGSIEMSITQQAKLSSYFKFVDDDYVIKEAPLKVTYKNPSPVQRKETYFNFSGYQDGEAIAGFVSGNLTYKVGDTVGSKKISAIDPFIALYINGCPNGGCHAFSPATLTSRVWQQNTQMQQTQDIIASLRINK